MGLNLSDMLPVSDPQTSAPSPHHNRDRVKGACNVSSIWEVECMFSEETLKKGGVINLVGGETEKEGRELDECEEEGEKQRLHHGFRIACGGG